MISVNGVSVSFGNFDLFRNITFVINPRDRIGLIGKNGAGKSTLLKLIYGITSPTSGQVVIPAGIRVGYLPQEMEYKDTRTVREEVRQAFREILSLQEELKHINQQIGSRQDYHSPEYEQLISRSSDIAGRLDILGSTSIEGEIETTLTGLGFRQEELDKPTSVFSGGWRMRIELAKTLLSRPEVLLLDEPTNHLDIESIQWLETFLDGFKGAVLVISHDRTFLNNVTNRTIEISLGKIYDYQVSYSKFVELSRERRENQKAAWTNQQKMIEDTERFIERFRYKATKAVQVQSRIKMLEKIERIEIEPEDTGGFSIQFPKAIRSGTLVVEAKDLSKAYGDKLILDRLNFVIERGEKVAFVGRNGEGKTTLSKVIVGETDHNGTLKIGHNVNIGYFAQNTDELLDPDITVFDTIDQVAKGEMRTKVRDLLGVFLFSGEDIDKKVKVLSGGEKSRLAMARLLLEPYNLLVLDEPTNHLDMRSKDLLKEALLKFDGTLILVSHDREFLHGLTQKVFEFHDHSIYQYPGDIFDFLRKKKMDSLRELESRRNTKKETRTPVNSESKKEYLEKKENDRKVKKVSNEIKQCENRIQELENSIAALTQQLSKPDSASLSYQDTELYTTFGELREKLNEEMSVWEKLQLEYDRIKAGSAE